MYIYRFLFIKSFFFSGTFCLALELWWEFPESTPQNLVVVQTSRKFASLVSVGGIAKNSDTTRTRSLKQLIQYFIITSLRRWSFDHHWIECHFRRLMSEIHKIWIKKNIIIRTFWTLPNLKLYNYNNYYWFSSSLNCTWFIFFI